ncbi:potassium voltage-gated channel subfamily B member 1 isoform X2 [Eurytemora carolleeae]|uniref:potassium voltage-gated channel subfamily B member 1 isoform X2 n=1 Tax=Eurytemora carolleeae TaxID=1294199 RepID=UPI000C792027|nr:potassium voltage-gated channel subfamily B member 1 isoform X2 [Eurytemora carolleeae]|eukprot:XP_023343630.1 potassium voltage-gated channel subfamily B member 1-like isoform X2 [Eurytemora affinis]
MVLVSVTVLTFSSLIYFAEKDSENKWSFLDSFWWGLMTLTTVGYGSKAPKTAVGQSIGGLCALMGIFILALPVPIVVNSFATNYKNRIWRNEVMQKKQEREAEGEKKEGFNMKDMSSKVDPEIGPASKMPKKSNGEAGTTVESFVNID